MPILALPMVLVVPLALALVVIHEFELLQAVVRLCLSGLHTLWQLALNSLLILLVPIFVIHQLIETILQQLAIYWL